MHPISALGFTNKKKSGWGELSLAATPIPQKNRGTIADQVFLSHLQSQAASIALHLVQPMVLGLIYRHLLAWLLSSQTPVVRGIIVSSAMQYNESNERGGERESYSITWYVQTKLMSLSR